MSAHRPTIIVIEDESRLRRVLGLTFEANGFRCIETGSARQGLLDAETYRPDLVLVDLGLPDRDGVWVIHGIRKWSTAIPIIVLSARSQETDKIAALDAGADDYVTKPFTTGELLARVRVAMRHAAIQGRAESKEVFSNGDLRVDLLLRRVFLKEKEIHLTPIEYRVLAVLIQNAGRVVTYNHLLRDVWGPGKIDQSSYVRTYIRDLRRKLEDDPTRPSYLHTEVGVGYRLVAG